MRRLFLFLTVVTLAAVAVVAWLEWQGYSNLIPSGPVVSGPLPSSPFPDTTAACERGALTGEVTHVRAGDTIEVDGQAIRLQGLAAPGRNEPGGEAAVEALRRMVEGRTVLCELTGESSDDHCVGVCYTEVDVGALLVRRGLARDCPRQSGGRYAEAEARAAQEDAVIGEIYPLPDRCLGP